MLVNSKGEKEQIPVINSTFFEEDADRDLDYAILGVAQALQRRESVSMLGKWKAAILGLITGAERETPTNSKEAEMSEVKKEDFDKLAGEVKTLSDSLPKMLADAVNAAVKPINDHVEALANSQKVKDEAELKDLRAKIVEAGTLTEAAANALTSLDVARELAPKAPGAAAALNGAFTPKTGDKGGTYTPPADEE